MDSDLPFFDIRNYIGFVVRFIVAFGLVFEMPVLSYFLTKIGLMTPGFLSRNRRYAIVLVFVLAAALTPPDVLSQLLMAVPLIVLYEISIWVSKLLCGKQERWTGIRFTSGSTNSNGKIDRRVGGHV